MCFQFQALAFRPFVETRCWLDLRSDNLSFEKIQIQVRQGGFGRHTRAWQGDARWQGRGRGGVQDRLSNAPPRQALE